MTRLSWQRCLAAWLAVITLLGVAGCGQTEATFRSNLVYIVRQEAEMGGSLGERQQDIDDILAALFGTPDEPHLPSLAEIDVQEVLSLPRLAMAAGPVGSDERGNPRGLFREHCAHCHGVTGDGRGPTAAFLNPYPRDFRMGKFKFKSTPVGSRPTHDDLRQILINGIPGTAMPSFKLLPADEVEALVHYVRYLSIRGEVERGLINTVFEELDDDDRLIDLSLRDSADSEKRELFEGQVALIQMAVEPVVSAWKDAEASATSVPKRPESLPKEEAIERGRRIFYTTANCNKCHGESALGDGQTTDYDEWTKELAPQNPQLLEKLLAAGALEPRNIIPRNLRQGVYRGGRTPVDIYWRVINGIEGTPMPGLASNVLSEDEEPDPKKLTQEDVWCLIEYVRHLPYEEISQPPEHSPHYQRERN